MADEVVTPGETVAPPAAEPAAPAAPPQPAPTGSEPEINSGEPAMVPSDRLREETEKRRQAEEETETLRQQLAERQTPPPVTDDDDIDPDVEDTIRKAAKKLGLVSREELAADQNKVQVQQDISDLTANPPNAGIPYDNKAVMDYAKTNNLPITSKAALRAAYREMNYDKIVEVERQKAIDGYKTAGASGAEQPGSSGAVTPQEPELTAKTPKERTRERIRNARQKLTV